MRRYTDYTCSGSYTTVASGLSAATTQYTDNTTSSGKTYFYQVVAKNNCTRTYDVLRNGAPVASGLAYGTTTFIDTTGTNGTTYTYTIRYNNGCGLSADTSPGIDAADIVDSIPCPAIGNTLLVTKNGSNVTINWTAVSCADFANYRIYGSTTYDASFPTGWTILGNPTNTTFSDPLASSYVAYITVSIDACGNTSSY